MHTYQHNILNYALMPYAVEMAGQFEDGLKEHTRTSNQEHIGILSQWAAAQKAHAETTVVFEDETGNHHEVPGHMEPIISSPMMQEVYDEFVTLRIKMLEEEKREFIKALANYKVGASPRMAEVMDAVCDMQFLMAADYYLMDGQPVFPEIYKLHEECFHLYRRTQIDRYFAQDLIFQCYSAVVDTNIAKLNDGNPIFSPEGKLMKPPGWVSPKATITALLHERAEVKLLRQTVKTKY